MGSAYRRTSDQACYAEAGSRLEKKRLYQMGMGKRKSKKRKGSACMGDCREGAEDSGRTGL